MAEAGAAPQRGWAAGERDAVAAQLGPLAAALLSPFSGRSGQQLTSEWRGVSAYQSGKWQAQTSIGGQRLIAYCECEEEAAAAFLLQCSAQHVANAVLDLSPSPGGALHPRLVRLQRHVRRRQLSGLLQPLLRHTSGGGDQRLAGTGPVVLAELLGLLLQGHQQQVAAGDAAAVAEQAAAAADAEAAGQAGEDAQQEAAAAPAAAEQQGIEVRRTPVQSLSRRLWFHLLRTLAVLCLVPLDRLLQSGVPVLSRRQVLCGRSLSWWCRQLERQALDSLGHANWRLGVLDHVLCLALAALPEQLPLVMSMANLRVMCRVLNAIRGCAGFVRLHGEVPSWRQLGSGEVTTERPQAVAEVEQEFAEHWAAQQAMLAAEPGAVITGQDRLRQAEPQFEHAAEAADVREQGMLRLSVFCGNAARIVAAERLPDYQPPEAASRYRRGGATGTPELYWPLLLSLDALRQCPCGTGATGPRRLTVCPDFAAAVVPLGVRLYMPAAAEERVAAGLSPLPAPLLEDTRQRLQGFVQQLLEPLLAAAPQAAEGADAVEDELWGEVHDMRDEEQLQQPAAAAEQPAEQPAEQQAQQLEQLCRRLGLRLHWLYTAQGAAQQLAEFAPQHAQHLQWCATVPWEALSAGMATALRCHEAAGLELDYLGDGGELEAGRELLQQMRSAMQPAWEAAQAALEAAQAALQGGGG